MYNVMRAELFKLRKRPAVWAILAVGVVLGQVFSYLIPYVAYVTGDTDGIVDGASGPALLASMMPDQIVGNSLGGFPVFIGALAFVFGALVFGGEFGWGTVKTLFTQRPTRATVLAGQLAAVVVSVAVGVAAMFGSGMLTSTGLALVEGESIAGPPVLDLLTGYGYGVLIMTMWAFIGAALGVAMRSVALPIGLGVVWILGIENLIGSMADSVLTALQPLRDVLPGANSGSVVNALLTDRMTEAPPGVVDVVSESRGLLTLAVYVLGCAAIAFWASRRDVV